MNKWTWTKPSRLVITALLSVVLAAPALAGPREQAKRIYDRLAGVPPTNAVLSQMETVIATNGGDPLCSAAGATGAACAAHIAMNDVSFYNVTLKNFAAPWTNRDMNAFVPLNDYVAMVIGMVRDDVPFNTLLSADIAYVGSGVAAPSASNNDHYAQLESNNTNLRDNLTQTTQSSINGLAPGDVAGAMTTRAAAEAFFIAGTNRAMFRFTLLNHLCNDMEQMHDPKLSPDRIRQDVSRSPGGDSRLFLNNCVGCHTGMDPMAQAFAYYNYDDAAGRLEFTDGVVQPKYFNNDLTFPPGFRTPNDDWENYWRQGQNAYLGFDPGLPGNGSGAQSLGRELGNSHAFASCQVKKVFKAVCLREPEDGNDRTAVDGILATFRGSSDPTVAPTGAFSLKQVFADTAVYCMGQ